MAAVGFEKWLEGLMDPSLHRPQLTSYSVSFNVLPFQAKRIMKRSAQSRKPFDKIRAGSVLMSEQSPISSRSWSHTHLQKIAKRDGATSSLGNSRAWAPPLP